MNKLIVIIFFGIISCSCSTAHDSIIPENEFDPLGRGILLTYSSALRVPCNYIKIEFTENNRNTEYSLHVKTFQMEGKTGFENTNKDIIIKIEKSYFDDIYNRLLNLNYKEIIENNAYVVGVDGAMMHITVGGCEHNIRLEFFSPDDTDKRKLTELNQIIKDIFTKAEIIEWYP